MKATIAKIGIVCAMSISTCQAIQCVEYARSRSGIQIYGDAWTWWGATHDKGSVPYAGSVMVWPKSTGVGNYGHVAYVSKVVSSNTVIIDHANWNTSTGAVDGKSYTNITVQDTSGGNWTSVKLQKTTSGGTVTSWTSSVPLNGFVYSLNTNPPPTISSISAKSTNGAISLVSSVTARNPISQVDMWLSWDGISPVAKSMKQSFQSLTGYSSTWNSSELLALGCPRNRSYYVHVRIYSSAHRIPVTKSVWVYRN